MKILVVDENEAICFGLCELLERGNPNYKCESATEGKAAFVKAKASKPDVVVLDFSMSGINASTDEQEKCAKLRQIEAFPGFASPPP